ncbi:hypothetical protein SLH49_18135 [Cognatiyoonia sp. IB215446]|uniref:hypothetical protein n=1 Tax=Cognatiyoonia sp. IB215446 TaxID=3097355 RepID=UPI002A133453|nr:hypothetical protein [Cognatiyoonia sp. IB215446]MDX8349911.1 hypothetical protein [Cognatiyoonia sp. IB215446]
MRHAIAAERAIASYHLIADVQKHIGGEVLDVRAFDLQGAVIYRVLMRQGDGTLCPLMLYGTSGEIIAPTTEIGRAIVEFSLDANGTSDHAQHSPASTFEGKLDMSGGSDK